jgi:cyclohexanone monooxygenase
MQRTNGGVAGDQCDVVIVGAGYAGLLMLHRVRGLGLNARVFERGDGVGGTWYWNRYPGARCDTESLEYSYQFSDDLFQNWKWSERFATQPELLEYAKHVAEHFNLLPHIQFNTSLKRASFDEASKRWSVKTDAGQEVSAKFLILATGCLSSTNVPKILGLSDFKGPLYHTGQWPVGGVPLAGKVVGIIGTGSSAVQAIPAIAPMVKELIVFQRTANYVVPAHNGPIAREYEAQVLANHAEFRHNNATMIRAHGYRNRGPDVSALTVPRQEVEQDLERRWQVGGLNFLDGYNDLLLDLEANKIPAEFVRAKIRSIVKDQSVADLLCPTHPIGCKRVSVGDGYYETYNRGNVHLVDIRSTPIEKIAADGPVMAGKTYGVDVLICATGFDAMTGPILSIEIVGRNGVRLVDKWAAGPKNYLGLSVNGFPNLFTMTGPGSPSVLTNMHVSIEHHSDWIANCLAAMMAAQKTEIEATESAEQNWVKRVDDIANGTIFPSCNSWYLGANIPGKPRMFMPYVGFPSYAQVCASVAADGYAGFRLT